MKKIFTTEGILEKVAMESEVAGCGKVYSCCICLVVQYSLINAPHWNDIDLVKGYQSFSIEMYGTRSMLYIYFYMRQHDCH